MAGKHLQAIAHALILVAIMLGLIAAALWLRPGPIEPAAQAQANSRTVSAADGSGIPDAGRQRLMTVELLDAINKRLADIDRGLRDGSYAIRVVESKGAGKQGGAKEAEQ
jgi:hypothetical protein